MRKQYYIIVPIRFIESNRKGHYKNNGPMALPGVCSIKKRSKNKQKYFIFRSVNRKIFYGLDVKYNNIIQRILQQWMLLSVGHSIARSLLSSGEGLVFGTNYCAESSRSLDILPGI